MPVPLQDFYHESVVRFGRVLKELRTRHKLSRRVFIDTLFKVAREDVGFWNRYIVVTEGWLRALEDGNGKQVPTWALRFIIEALQCTPEETGRLLDCLVPDVSEFLNSNRTVVSSSGPLTKRELEVLRLGATGLVSREIAEKLTVEKGTVDSHWNNIRAKLRAGSRRQAILLAHDRGII